ncbi:glycosyltransferase family 1 protein [Sulfurimonas sp. HSL3-7]|uniref:glycosyltransferase family 4 protein n=1 Tax=Sulfonitrofixus jiaomeiensis TaxID=3131938 RepID=UPI0031F724D8
MNTELPNIILVSDTVFDSNGVSRFIHDMAKFAPSYGSRFNVITSSPLETYGFSDNILNVKSLLSIRMPFYKEQFISVIPPFWRLFNEVRAFNPDVIHISTPGSLGICALLIAKMLNIKVVGTYHTDFPSYIYQNTKKEFMLAATRGYMRFFYQKLDKVFARSQQNLKILETEIHVNAENLVEIRAGTDIEAFSPSFASETIWATYDIDKNAVKLLYVGRLSVEKNFDFLLDLFQRYRTNSDKKVVLVAVGEGSRLKEKERLKEEGIYLLGRKKGEELSRIYASSDLFVFPSVTETLGQAVMEAAASGLSAVVSNQGGVTQSVEHGVNGYCVDTNNELLWLEKMDELICNGSLRREMGQSARAKMEGRSIKSSCEQFLKQHDFELREKRG